MQARQLIIGLALAAVGLAVGGATVRADEGEQRDELHLVRHRVPVVIDRTASLNRLDRLLAGIEELAALTEAPVHTHGRGPVRVEIYGRVHLRDDGDDEREELRSRGGAEPAVGMTTLGSYPSSVARAVDQRIDAMRRELIEMRRTVLLAPEVEPVRRYVPATMAAQPFAAFVRDVRCAPFAGDRVAMVRDVVRHAHFTSAQAEVVVRAIQPWGQVAAAVALHARVVDPESFHVVFQALTFPSDREELRRQLQLR